MEVDGIFSEGMDYGHAVETLRIVLRRARIPCRVDHRDGGAAVRVTIHGEAEDAERRFVVAILRAICREISVPLP